MSQVLNGGAFGQQGSSRLSGRQTSSHSNGVVMKVIVDKEEAGANAIRLISGHLCQHVLSDAVKQWKYRPFLLNGMPVEVETQVLMNTLAS